MNQSSHDPESRDNSQRGHAHGGHNLMMIACCIPMLAIAIILVATGVAGVGFIFAAVVCTLMMAMMMRGGHGGRGSGDGRN